MNNPIADRLNEQRSLVIDGGLSTALEEAQVQVPKHALWTGMLLLEEPAALQAAHLAYLEAGADVILTASYQATPQGFAQAGYTKQQAEFALRASLQLARAARQQHGLLHGLDEGGRPHAVIACSIGPYGAYLADGSEFRGDDSCSQAQLEDFHRPRMEALLPLEPELFALETTPSLREARAFLSLLDQLGCGVPCWVSFCCKDGEHLSDGTRFSEAIDEVTAHPGVIAAGVNCTAPQHIEALLRSVPEPHRKPLLAYPNGGAVWNTKLGDWDARPPGTKGLARMASTWIEAGASLLGGCCQTGPMDIRNLARELA